MIYSTLAWANVSKSLLFKQVRRCHSVFGYKDILSQDKSERFSILPVMSNQHDLAMEVMKQYCLSEHVIVKARKMDLGNDRALDEYLIGILKQGNTLLAKTEDDKTAGICVGFASSPVDSRNLRTYAFYRQDPNTKDFLNFTAKLQETPNLWEVFKQKKIFEIKMLAVLPEFRRQGLAVTLVEKARETALDQGYKIIRMDCLNPYETPKLSIFSRLQSSVFYDQSLVFVEYNFAPFLNKELTKDHKKQKSFRWSMPSRCFIPFPALMGKVKKSTMETWNTFPDATEGFLAAYEGRTSDVVILYDSYKIAERNMMQCIVKFPLHKLRGLHAPFIKRSSKYNCLVRVYVDARTDDRPDRTTLRQRQADLESLIE